MARRCSPPRSQSVRSHWRRKSRNKRAIAAKRAAGAKWLVVDTRTGSVVSRHRTLTAAINSRQRLDRVSFRAGRGRPYSTRRA